MSKTREVPAHRSFIAIELPEYIREMLVNLQAAMWPCHGFLRLVPPDRMHLTLRFLGDLKPEIAAELLPVLRTLTTRTVPFTLRLSGIGTFPRDAARPRVLWVGLENDVGLRYLRVLADEVEVALRSLSMEAADHPFSPHLTIARVRDRISAGDSELLRQSVEALRADTTLDGSFRVTRVVLMRSDFDRGDLRYTPLATATLGDEIPTELLG